MGEFDAALAIVGAQGEMSGKSGTGPMEQLNIGDGTLAWSFKIDKPMPMTLKFDGAHDGTTLSGKVKFGMFASGTFTGTRAAA